jgi:hypothetical protein
MIKYRKDKVGLSNSKKNFFYVINFFRIFDNKKIMYFLIKEKKIFNRGLNILIEEKKKMRFNRCFILIECFS